MLAAIFQTPRHIRILITKKQVSKPSLYIFITLPPSYENRQVFIIIGLAPHPFNLSKYIQTIPLIKLIYHNS